jgi:hypothetical protein
MITIVLVVLTAACVLLTVTFLAVLRGIAELRLRLGGHSARSYIDAGSALPAALLRALNNPEDTALIAFVSDGCDACEQLTTLLPSIPVTTLACILGHDNGDIRGHLGADVIIADPTVTAAAARELKINASPVVILQHAGLVVGSAYGVSTQTEDELQLWWKSAQETIREKTR